MFLACALVVVSLAGLAAYYRLQPPSMVDVVVYRAEGHAAASGGDLYGFTVTHWNLPATYPPFAALLFVPTSWPSLIGLKEAALLVNLGLLAAVTFFSARLAGPWPRLRPEHRLPVLVGATGVAVWLEPVFQTLTFGQINLAVTLLVLYDLTRPDGARGKGFAIGLAAGIKLTPALFAVYLLLTGRPRAAGAALAGFVSSVLLGLLVLPGASVDYWTHRIFETRRVGQAWIVDNQSLQGLVARALHTPRPGLAWLGATVVVLCAGLWLARRLRARHGLEAWAVLCVAVTALLVSPISWTHHWVWCVPLLAVLASHAERSVRRRALVVAVGVVFTARSMWILPHKGDLDLRFSWWQQPFGAPYPLLGLAFLGVLGLLLRRRESRAPAPPGTPAARATDAAGWTRTG